MISSRVRVTDNFPRVTAAVDELAREAVEEGARVGAASASRAASSRRDSGLMEEMDVLPVEAAADGWRAGFRSRAWYAQFQDGGTVAGRTRAVKASTARRRTSASGAARFAKVAGSKGIRPLRFFARGKRDGHAAMLARISRGFRGD